MRTWKLGDLKPGKFAADARYGVEICQHVDEVVFEGRCPCGREDCNLWQFTFRGRTQQGSKKFYDRLVFLAAQK